LTSPSLSPALKQKFKFLRPPDERRRNAMLRIKAALCTSLAGNAPGTHRTCETLKIPVTEVDCLKQPANQPMRAVGNDDGARLGQHLQARREIGCLPDDGFFLR